MNDRHRKSGLAAVAGILLLLSVPGLQAQPDEDGEPAAALDPVVVVSHRQPRSLSEVAGTVTVIGAERMEHDLADDLSDLVRYEPGVSLDGGGTRFGHGGFRIRGIGGNRTALVIDNVPAPDRFTVGNFADSGRGLLELGLIGRVEILRGPASTLYGSKALGGVVAVSLLDADDVLAGSSPGGQLSAALSGADDSRRLTAAVAGRDGSWRWLAAGASRRADALDAAGMADDFPADDQDRDQDAVLLRASRQGTYGSMRLTVDGIRDRRETDVRALLGTGRFANTTRLTGDDRVHRSRVLLDGELYGSGWLARGHWRAWHQVADTRQDTDESRPIAPTPVELFRRFNFRQESTGIGADLESEGSLGGFRHRLGYGFEAVSTDLSQRRDARQTNLETGQSTDVVLGEAFPLRDFPRTRVREFGAYVHDEIRLWDSGPMLSPGLRFEYYELDGRADPVFTDAFPDSEIIDLDTTAWMPKLGLVWPVTERGEFFAQYARGFRSPPFEDVNIGLDIPMFNIRAIPNPDLAPEKGETLEAGVRWRGPDTRLDLAVFRNDYRDFIATRAALGPDPGTGTLLFQSINRDRVRIEGAELRAWQALGAGFALEVAAEWSRGEDRETGRNLQELTPPRAMAALEYAAPDWDVRLIATATRAQRSLEDESGNPLFSPPGHGVVDLIGRWYPHPDLRIAAGVFNLGDRRYWDASRVSGRPPGDPTLPLLAEPGRHLRARLSWQF